MMFASFNSQGTTPSFNDKLNTLASGILICSTVSIVVEFSNMFLLNHGREHCDCSWKWLVLMNSSCIAVHGVHKLGFIVAV